MSGIELLGFACNIMQVISYSREVISLCSNVYQGNHPDAELTELAAFLHTISSDVQTHFDKMRIKTADERRLCDIATRCAIAARDLEEEISFITSRQKQGSLASTLRIAAKTTWRKRRLDRLEKSLREHEHVLDTHLMARVCKQTDAVELKQKEGFEKLGTDIQYFVSQYALGHKKLHELVQKDIQSSQRASEKAMKAHVTEKITRSQAAVFSRIASQAEVATDIAKQRLHDLNIQAKDDSARERFLQSLKYSAMNERRNHLTDSHGGTFKWIFNQNGLSDENDDEDYDEGDDYEDYEDDEDYKDDEDYEDEEDHEDHKDYEGEEEYEHDEDDEDDEDENDEDDEYNGDDEHYERDKDYKDPPWDNFQDWLKSDSDIYWISGKPGSGKSTLMKFLITHPLTKVALQSWRSDFVIVSHFFWKPGSMMQRNIKGLFAALLHQLLSLRPNITQGILASFKDLRVKDSDADWSVRELQVLCLGTIQSYPSSICMFLDGLDEICDEDGVSCLMEILELIKAVSTVKICIASRQEQRFRLYLFQVPQLKLHDLTSKDIQHYADQELRTVWSRRQDLLRWTLRKTVLPELVRKAHGVFLWVTLAIRSLISGLENGDSSEDLILRLQDLPTELSQMYADMWTRVNGNTKIHRESTARLLNLLITHRKLQKQGGSGNLPAHVLDIMGAMALTMQTRLFSDCQTPSTEAAVHASIQVRELVEARCIGLVETRQSEVTWYGAHYNASLMPHITPTVAFIHRTAYDFLTDTEEGRYILSYDPSSKGERYFQFVRGQVLAAAITRGRLVLRNILAKLARASHFASQKMTHDLLIIFWKLYNRDLIECAAPNYESGSKRHFLTFVEFPEFQDFLVATIKKSPQPSLLATEVLRDTATRRAERLVGSSTLRLLISLGADPNLKTRRCCWTDNPSDPAYTVSLSALQGIMAAYFVDHRHFRPNSQFDPFSNPSPQEVLCLCENTNAALTESLCMSINHYGNEDEVLFPLGLMDSGVHLSQEPLSEAPMLPSTDDTVDRVNIIIETKTAFLLDVIQRHQFARLDHRDLPARPKLSKNQMQDHSSFRVRYVMFGQLVRDPDYRISTSCCRVQNQGNVQQIENLIKSWLFDRCWEDPDRTMWRELMRVHDEIVAGSKAYERVYGNIMEHLVDEDLGFCKISKAEIYQRAQHMAEESPDAPGHWL